MYTGGTFERVPSRKKKHYDGLTKREVIKCDKSKYQNAIRLVSGVSLAGALIHRPSDLIRTKKRPLRHCDGR